MDDYTAKAKVMVKVLDFCPVWWPRFGGISPPNWPLTSHSLGRLARLLSSGGIPPLKRCPTLRRRVAVRSRTTASPGS